MGPGPDRRQDAASQRDRRQHQAGQELGMGRQDPERAVRTGRERAGQVQVDGTERGRNYAEGSSMEKYATSIK